MAKRRERKGGLLDRLAERLRDTLVQRAPEHSAACEFECSKHDCRHDEWAECRRRLRSVRSEERSRH